MKGLLYRNVWLVNLYLHWFLRLSLSTNIPHSRLLLCVLFHSHHWNFSMDPTAPFCTTSFNYSIGDLVLAEWQDRIFYALIKRIDHHNRKCEVMFEDKKRGTVKFENVHHGKASVTLPDKTPSFMGSILGPLFLGGISKLVHAPSHLVFGLCRHQSDSG